MPRARAGRRDPEGRTLRPASATAIVSAVAGIPVRTENAILIDYMTESPNVSGDDRSAILLADAVRLAERRSLVLHPDGKEQGIFSSE